MITQFETVEEAWFWFFKCEQFKQDGGQPISGLGLHERPCSPIDIYIVVTYLSQMGALRPYHISTIKHFGREGYAPDPRINDGDRDERQAAIWWNEAMSIIEPKLIEKGILTARGDSENVISLRVK